MAPLPLPLGYVPEWIETRQGVGHHHDHHSKDSLCVLRFRRSILLLFLHARVRTVRYVEGNAPGSCGPSKGRQHRQGRLTRFACCCVRRWLLR